MKKILSIILVLSLVFALGTTAFAEETTTVNTEEAITDSNADATFNVSATFSSSESSTNVVHNYKVVITWTVESTLKYSTGGTTTYTWNTGSMTYDSTPPSTGWSGSANITVDVTNYSDVAIKATVADTPSVNGADVTWNYTETTAASAAGASYTDPGAAKSASQITGTINSEDITGEIGKDTNVSTVTVTLSKAA